MRALGPLGSDITAPARHANAAILFMRDRYRARPQTSEYLGPCTCPAWEGRGEQARDSIVARSIAVERLRLDPQLGNSAVIDSKS